MEKIVVVYQVPADWGSPYKIVLSFLYKSPEDWLVDFEKTLTSIVEKKKLDWEANSNEFHFCGYLFEIHNFCNVFADSPTYNLPAVYSLEEWFKKNLQETVP